MKLELKLQELYENSITETSDEPKVVFDVDCRLCEYFKKVNQYAFKCLNKKSPLYDGFTTTTSYVGGWHKDSYCIYYKYIRRVKI